MISWCLWHPGKKNDWEIYESQSPVLDIAERRRENYDNVAFTRSKYYSCNNSPNTLVKLRSKHYYLYPEACQRWYALEFILSKTELFSSSLETNMELRSKLVAEVRIDPGTCWVSSPCHLTTIKISCTEVAGSYITSRDLLCFCCRVDHLSRIWLLSFVWRLPEKKQSLFPLLVINHKFKQAGFFLECQPAVIKQFVIRSKQTWP